MECTTYVDETGNDVTAGEAGNEDTLGTRVVKNLTYCISGQHSLIVFDIFFSSFELMEALLADSYVVGRWKSSGL
jgi:hypothetical protein